MNQLEGARPQGHHSCPSERSAGAGATLVIALSASLPPTLHLSKARTPPGLPVLQAL